MNIENDALQSISFLKDENTKFGHLSPQNFVQKKKKKKQENQHDLLADR